jgi:hypothetical protein
MILIDLLLWAMLAYFVLFGLLAVLAMCVRTMNMLHDAYVKATPKKGSK